MNTFTFPNYIGSTQALVRTITDDLGRSWTVPAGGAEDDPPDDPPSEDPPEDDPPEDETSELEQQATEAIQALRDAGQEIPEALEAAVNEFRAARKEAAQYRTDRNDLREEFDNLKTNIAKAFGFDDEDDDPDPDRLQQAIAERDAENRRLRVLNALGDVLPKDVNRKLTRAVLREDGVLDELDPEADDFTDQLEAAVNQAVEDNPQLRDGQGPPPGAADQGPRGNADTQPKDLKSAIAAHIAGEG